MSPNRLILALVVALSLLLPACGGGGGTEAVDETISVPTEVTLDVGADVLMTGQASENGSGTRDAFPGPLMVGSRFSFIPTPHTEAFRALLTFDLSGIPAGSRILSAQLTVVQMLVEGNPYATQPLLVDHVDLGGSLDAADYDSIPLTAVIGALATDSSIGAKTMSATAAIQADVDAGRTAASFRGYFSSVGGSHNTILQDPADVFSTGLQIPTLTIRYE